MANSSRSGIRGFRLKEHRDTPTYEVEVGTIEDGNAVFVVHIIRNKDFGGDFMIAKVYDSTGQNLLWSFQQEEFGGVGFLAEAGDRKVIALVGKGKDGKVEQVIPLSRFAGASMPDLRTLIRMKAAAAKSLGRDFRLTPNEDKLYKRDLARAEEERRAEAEAAAEAKRAAREKKIAEIVARGQLTAYTAEGRPRFGLPVLEDEWPTLHNNTYVVRVESIGKDGALGKLIEAFQVIKRPGKNPQKGFPAAVTAEKPSVSAKHGTSAKPKGPAPVDHLLVEDKEGKAYEVVAYASMDDIRAARSAGLNGGTYVAVKPAEGTDKVEVFAIYRDRVETVGNCALLA